jgi:hypothetical protein
MAAWHSGLLQPSANSDKTLTLDDKSKYGLIFETDGRASTRIDRNRGMGT